MYLKKLMDDSFMTRADLSRISGVPESTLRDILNGKAQLDRCEAGTLYNIAEALETTVEDILDHYWGEWFIEEDPEDEAESIPLHDDHSLLLFYKLVDMVTHTDNAEEVFRFVSWISREHYIDGLYSMGHYREVFFLIGLIDYVNKQHDLKTDTRFDAYRKYCLDIPVYALSTLEEYDDADMLDEAKEYAETFAIPEFAAFNIFMTEDDIRTED